MKIYIYRSLCLLSANFLLICLSASSCAPENERNFNDTEVGQIEEMKKFFGLQGSPAPNLDPAPEPNPAPSPPVILVRDVTENRICEPSLAEAGTFEQSNCVDGLICLPENFVSGAMGRCRVPCDKQREKENADDCPANRFCQSVTSSTGARGLGDFCLRQVKLQDAECRAIGDNNACAEGMECLPIRQEKDKEGRPYIVSQCKVMCDYAEASGEKTCSDIKQNCLKHPGLTFPQKDADDTGVTKCNLAACMSAPQYCECNADENYSCRPSDHPFIGSCQKPRGWCGNAVSWVKSSDFQPSGYEGEYCNEKNSHDYCADEPWSGVEKPGHTQCVPLEQSGKGICFAACWNPAQGGPEGQCPESYSCTDNVARKLGFSTGLGDKTCTAAEDCGSPGAECAEGKCIGFYKSCEILPEPEVSGVTEVVVGDDGDIKQPDSDAEEDAGSSDDVNEKPVDIVPEQPAIAELGDCKVEMGASGFEQGDCEEGLTCLPEKFEPDTSFKCRKPCFEKEILENGLEKVVKKSNVCSDELSCQVLNAPNLEGAIGAFCVERVLERDATCRAVFDDNACADNMKCVIVGTAQSRQGVKRYETACKKLCPFGDELADGACAIDLEEAQETCFKIPRELDIGKKPNKGWCGKEVAWAGLSDFADNKFTGEACNEKTDHRYCNAKPWAGLEKPGQVNCLGLPGGDGDGYCFAACGSPTVDVDQSGVITENEQGEEGQCPEGYACTPNLGRERRVMSGVEDFSSRYGYKVCKLENCTPNEPCAEECGPGDTECIAGLIPSEEEGLCAAPVKSCEPV